MNKIFKRGRWRRKRRNACTFYTIEEERKRKIEKALSKGRGSRAFFSRKGGRGKEVGVHSFKEKRKERVYFLEENKGARGGI
jgi:hypothetical protein